MGAQQTVGGGSTASYLFDKVKAGAYATGVAAAGVAKTGAQFASNKYQNYQDEKAGKDASVQK